MTKLILTFCQNLVIISNLNFLPKAFLPNMQKIKVCASHYHRCTFFKDLLTVATDIEGGCITSIGNKRPLSAWDKFYMSLTGFAFEGKEPIKIIKNSRDGVGGSKKKTNMKKSN